MSRKLWEIAALALVAASDFVRTGEIDRIWCLGPVEFAHRLRWWG